MSPIGFFMGCLTATIFINLYEPKRRLARHEAIMRPMREEYEKLRRPTGNERKTPSNTVAAA